MPSGRSVRWCSKGRPSTAYGTDELRAPFAGGGGGVDYTFFKAIGDADLTFAAEYFFDTRPPDAPPTFFAHNAFGGFRLMFNDTAGTELSGGAVVDVLEGTTFGRLGLSRRFGEHWRAYADGNLFLGTPGTLETSFVNDDYVHARLAYFF